MTNRPVALITPTYRRDIERFALLCDSIDRYVSSYERHYVIVTDDDLSPFSQFESARRHILPSSRFLPRWLRLAPPVVSSKGRRVWWSFRSKPVHGWHVQQIVKIAAVLQAPEERFCLIDSDNAFIRPFDVGRYAGGARTPLYVDPAAIAANAPLHAVWIRTADRLLGAEKPTSFPADDFIGHVIVWDQSTVRDMTQTIERLTGKDWVHALCAARDFSEFLLYGRFVLNSAPHAAAHEITTESLANSYWDGARLDAAAVTAMVRKTPDSKVALGIQSFSRTPVTIIREAIGLRQRDSTTALLKT